jgi:hypothetical protein
VQFGEIQAFRRNTSLLSSGYKNKPSNKLLFLSDPEDGGDIALLNVRLYPKYTVLQHGR